MGDFLMSLDWASVLEAVWTCLLLPTLVAVGNEIRKWAQSKKIDKYTDILSKHVMIAVKDVYQTMVENLKHTDAWTEDKMIEVKEIAKQKAIQALSNMAYETLKQANDDFEAQLDSMIEASLYDLKYGKGIIVE